MTEKNIKLSVNTGFAVNRIIDNETFVRFVKNNLKINYIQPTSDWLNLFMPDRYTFKNVKNLNKLLTKSNIKVNSCFTGAFTRLNHLAHPDKEQQKHWINYFKNFIDLSIDLGANYVGSHLGILSYDDNKKRNKILSERVIKNWHIIAEYAEKRKLKSLIWEPMSISREFGETLNECKKIQNLLNKKKSFNFKLCLDVGHGAGDFPGLRHAGGVEAGTEALDVDARLVERAVADGRDDGRDDYRGEAGAVVLLHHGTRHCSGVRKASVGLHGTAAAWRRRCRR